MRAIPESDSLIHRLASRDRALFLRVAMGTSSRRSSRVCWTVGTHLGGTTTSVLLALAPFFVGGVAAVGARAAYLLAISHAVVQIVKRTVGRPRPSSHAVDLSLVAEPDRFSFPSGHATAAMAVAFAYAFTFPVLAAPIFAVAFLIGVSRVLLGVHYPGDVLMGQAIAALTAVTIMPLI